MELPRMQRALEYALAYGRVRHQTVRRTVDGACHHDSEHGNEI